MWFNRVPSSPKKLTDEASTSPVAPISVWRDRNFSLDVTRERPHARVPRNASPHTRARLAGTVQTFVTPVRWAVAVADAKRHVPAVRGGRLVPRSADRDPCFVLLSQQLHRKTSSCSTPAAVPNRTDATWVFPGRASAAAFRGERFAVPRPLELSRCSFWWAPREPGRKPRVFPPTRRFAPRG